MLVACIGAPEAAVVVAHLNGIFEALLCEAVPDIAAVPALAAAGQEEMVVARSGSGPIRRYLVCGRRSLSQSLSRCCSQAFGTHLHLLYPRSSIPLFEQLGCMELGMVERRQKLERSLFAHAEEKALVMSPMAMLLLDYQHHE